MKATESLLIYADNNKKLKSTKNYAIPYLVWCFVLILIPSLVLIFIAFSTYDFTSGSDVSFTFNNFSYIFGSEYAISVFWPSIGRSFYISGAVTIICFFLGYPVAYLMKSMKPRVRAIIMGLLVLPLWSNQVLRIVSWRTIFELLHTNTTSFYQINIIIAMVSMYLPFMILPIYTVLEKIDSKIIEASYDLGASRKQTFFKVTLPLSLGGIISGVIMTFLPSLTSFEVSDAVSYQNITLLGNLIYERFRGTGGFNVGSVFSIVTVVFSIVGFILVIRVDKEGETLI